MEKNLSTLTLAMLIAILGGLTAGCSKDYDDTEIWNKVNELDRRVTNIEATLSQLNTDVGSLQVLLEAKQGGVSISSVTQTAEGYTIVFSDGRSITLHHGKDGDAPTIVDGYWYIGGKNTGVKAQGNDGATPEIRNGYWWIAGRNTGVPATGGTGSVGSTVNVPIIGVEEYGGVYYWTQTINGITTFLTDKDGNKFPVSGSTAVRPLIQISVTGYWVISYDGGTTWVQIVDGNGSPVKAGGGECDCKTFFLDVYYADGIITFILADGQKVQIPCEEDSDIRFDLVIPEELRVQIGSYMPIYTGLTPPDVEGVFRMDPTTTVFCSDFGNGGDAPGTVKNSMLLRFKNQDSRLCVIDVDQNEENEGTFSSKTVYVSGKGDNFTIYYNIIVEQDGITAREAIVISGTKTATGIKNLYYGLSMVEKSNDPQRKLMSTGAYRIYRDGDGMSESTVWNASASRRWRMPLSQYAE